MVTNKISLTLYLALQNAKMFSEFSHGRDLRNLKDVLERHAISTVEELDEKLMSKKND